MSRRWLTPGRFGLACAWGAVLGIIVLGLLVNPALTANDPFTYAAAGERLNAGHLLYALSPGDRPVAMNPPYWTVPLLGPPPIAVLWRPLAILPAVSIPIWMATSLVACLLSAAWVTIGQQRRFVATIVIAVLSQGLALLALTGNVDGLLLCGTLLVWRFRNGGHERLLGIVVALAVAVKLTPFIFGWWLMVQRRWSAVTAAVVTGLVIVAVTFVGAGPDSFRAYLEVAGQTLSGGATEGSLAGIAEGLGLPHAVATLLPIAFLASCGLVIVALRDRPAPAYIVAVIATVFGSPVVNFTNQARLLAVLAVGVHQGTPDPPGRRPASEPSGSRRRGSRSWFGALLGFGPDFPHSAVKKGDPQEIPGHSEGEARPGPHA